MEYTIKEYAEEISRCIPGSEIVETKKNNNVTCTGIKIAVNDEGETTHTLYVDGAFSAKITVDMVVKEINNFYANMADLMPKRRDVMNIMSHYEKNRIRAYLINENMNKEDDTPGINYLDLKIIFKVDLRDIDPDPFSNRTAVTTVSKDILNAWDLTPDELLKDAIDNMRPLIRPLNELIPLEAMEELVASGCPEPVSLIPMYIISNRDLYYGASSILSPEILDNLREDMILIPSSVHEFIAVPASSYDETADGIAAMIQETNHSQVNPTEWLSTHPYYFDAQNKMIRIM